jgi:hypothetical protein
LKVRGCADADEIANANMHIARIADVAIFTIFLLLSIFSFSPPKFFHTKLSFQKKPSFLCVSHLVDAHHQNAFFAPRK